MSNTLANEQKGIQGLHIETPAQMCGSPFHRAYEGAFTCLSAIIREQTSKVPRQEFGRRREDPLDAEYYFDVDEPNTIIAFAGDRGEGKTSTMLSFVSWLHSFSTNHSLIDAAEKEHSECPWQEFKSKYADSVRFHVLPVIDPTRMNEQDSILGSVVARMFAEYNEGLMQHSPSIEQRRRFVETSEKVYQIVQMLYGDKKLQENLEALEGLSGMAETQKARKRLYELVCAYLELQSSTGTRQGVKSFLVIPVDDLDMNGQHAVRFTEELRRYFMLPNVIIVLAASISQLLGAIEDGFARDTMTREQGNGPAHELAAKYINKFLPLAHRHYLPSLVDLKFGELEAKDIGIQNDQVQERLLVNHLLRLVYDRTGLLLVRDATSSHAILPTNLRALQQLNKLLMDLKPVKVHFIPPKMESERADALKKHQEDMVKGHNRETFEKNLNALQNYIINDRINGLSFGEDWTDGKAEKVLTGVARSMVKVHWQNLNAFVINSLSCLLEQEKDHILKRILEAAKYPETLSMGDVMYLLGQVQRDHVGREVGGLISIIHLLYSIQLQHLYYDAVSHAPLIYPAKKQCPELEQFRKLVGGFVFEPDSVQFVPSTHSYTNDWRLDVEIPYLPWGQEEAFNNSDYEHPQVGVDRTVGSLYEALEAAWRDFDPKEDQHLPHQSMLTSLEHLQFYVGYYGKPQSALTKQNGDGSKSESVGDVEVEHWRKHGRPTDEYYSVPLTYPADDDRRTERFSLNYLACIANALTPFQTCNRIFDWLFREGDGEAVTEETISCIHRDTEPRPSYEDEQEDPSSGFTLKNMCEWQQTYHTLLPLYSLDWMNALFNRMRAQARSQRKSAFVSEADSAMRLKFFWTIIKNSLEDTLSDAPYLNSEEQEHLLQSLEKCPLYIAGMLGKEEANWIACAMENQRCTKRSRVRKRYLKARERLGLKDITTNDIKKYVEASGEMVEFAVGVPRRELPDDYEILYKAYLDPDPDAPKLIGSSTENWEKTLYMEQLDNLCKALQIKKPTIENPPVKKS